MVQIPHQLTITHNHYIRLRNEVNLFILIKGLDKKSMPIIAFNGKMLLNVFPQRLIEGMSVCSYHFNSTKQ